MAITAASRPRPAHLSSELKYGAAMLHTVASVERIFFTDLPSPEEGPQGLEGMEELADLRLRLGDFEHAAACRSHCREPSMAGTARGAAAIKLREVVSG